MPDNYSLVESGALEHLLRTHFLQTQSLLLFEHLLSHSDRPMFLSARKAVSYTHLDVYKRQGNAQGTACPAKVRRSQR